MDTTLLMILLADFMKMKICLHIWIFLYASFGGTTARIKMCLVNGRNVRFDPNERICCNGALYKRSNYTRTIDCCTGAKRLYYPDGEVCCGSIVRNVSDFNGDIYKCCKSEREEELYKENEDICCNGKLYKGTKKGSFGCCGTKKYDPQNARCCNRTVHLRRYHESCCGDLTYNESSHDCHQNKVLPNFHKLCGGILYDIRRSHCCVDTLHSIAQPHKYNACCGTKLWRTDIEKCVKNQILPKGFSLCNTSKYNTTQYGCCEGTVMRKPGPRRDCCGSEMIDYTKDRCCEKKKFSVLNEICCGGSILQIGEKCCAGKRINPKTQLCCHKTLETKEHIILKKSNIQNMCCPNSNGGIPYDSILQMCTWENNVVLKNNISYCGRKLINHGKDLCCNYKLHQNYKTRGHICCKPGFRTYNPRTHTCSHGVPHRVNRNQIQKFKTRDFKFRRRCPKHCEKVYKNFKAFKALVKKRKSKVLTKTTLRKRVRTGKRCRCVYTEKRSSKRKRMFKSKRQKRKKSRKSLMKRRNLAGIIIGKRHFYFFCGRRIKKLRKHCFQS